MIVLAILFLPVAPVAIGGSTTGSFHITVFAPPRVAIDRPFTVSAHEQGPGFGVPFDDLAVRVDGILVGNAGTDLNGDATFFARVTTAGAHTIHFASTREAPLDSWSDPVTFVAVRPPSPPGVPSAGAVDLGRVTISWTYPADDAGAPVDYYALTREGGGPTKIFQPLRTLSYADVLKPNSTYTYTVRAVHVGGSSAPSEALSVVTGAAPGAALQVQAVSALICVNGGRRCNEVSDGGRMEASFPELSAGAYASTRVWGRAWGPEWAPGTGSVQIRSQEHGTTSAAGVSGGTWSGSVPWNSIGPWSRYPECLSTDKLVGVVATYAGLASVSTIRIHLCLA